MSLPHEKAKYLAVAVAATLDRSPEKNTKFVAVDFEVVEDAQYTGERPYAWKGFFTERSSDRTVESLQHMGYQGDNLEDFASLDGARCRELLPNVVEIEVEPETFVDKEGIERTVVRVAWVNRAGGGRFKAANPLEGGELKAFAAEMRSKFRNARGPKQPPPPPRSTNGGGRSAHPNAPGNDDVPFLHSDMSVDPSPIARVLR